MPLLRYGLATVTVFSALSSWNAFLPALRSVQGAALTMVTMPMIAVYVMFHRQVAGLTEGSTK